MATLSHDVIHDVLCRLGVKDLLRFRCVSKPWCSLIDDPDFIKCHLSHSLKTNTNLSLILRDCNLVSVDFDSLKTVQRLKHPLDESDEGNGTEILGSSCNGLLALYNVHEEIGLWNPSTRKSQMLPATKIEFPPWAFCVQFIVYGLGYDPVSDDYKLVRMVQFFGKDDDSFDSEVKVYSLSTNCWRRIQDFPYYLKYKRSYGVLANNALHWVVSKRPESDTQSFVIAFDLRTEEYRVVELPNGLDMSFHMNLKSMGGCLCLIANYWEVHVVDIWIMKEYGVKESWTKLISVKHSKSFPSFEFVLPLAFSKNGDKVLLNVDDNKFVWYDLRSKRVDKVRIGGLPRLFEVEMLVESLVPLNGNRAMTNKKQQNVKKKKKQRKNSKRDDFLSKGFHLVL
ncbi:hypothetical protein F3Y22_tig00116954pilonHSYRG00143 [Hibiscus syriacus]|uniref:F-box domain-containing protein n=1 Tax=Hibiscus syriacus TaxID=106335 RepID=A0A6A2WKT8_HIBSY|nr:F-box protein CPR1-like [Hibiscus syriacus]KAE8660313.1 hypothetical protein F3Y22_tig00116954pilonHSYRG00143 [Hibiscus syriacus]